MFTSALSKSYSSLLARVSLPFQRAIVSTNYRSFVETRRPPLRMEDYLKENEEMAEELGKEKKTPAGIDMSHRSEAERFNRGDEDGKRPPQDLWVDYSKPYREFRAKGPRNFSGEPAIKIDQSQTIMHSSPFDSPEDWAKIAGHDKASYEEFKAEQAEEKKFEEDLKKGIQNVEEKIVHAEEEVIAAAKGTVQYVTEKMKKL